MRKQYHFWPAEIGEGLDAWDVHRLIRLARDLPVKRVAVDAIWEVDTDYWSDAASGPSVRRVLAHMRAVLDVDTSYPIILGYDGRVMMACTGSAGPSSTAERPSTPFSLCPIQNPTIATATTATFRTDCGQWHAKR